MLVRELTQDLENSIIQGNNIFFSLYKCLFLGKLNLRREQYGIDVTFGVH